MVLCVIAAPAAHAEERPTIWVDGKTEPGQTVILKIKNPIGARGGLLIASEGALTAIRIAKSDYTEVPCKVPNSPGQLFTCQFFTWDGDYVGSNVLPITVDEQGGGGPFSAIMDVKPICPADEISGYAMNALAVVPVYLAEQDDVRVDGNGFCNLKATMLTKGGPRIVAQQFNALQVHHRDDPNRRRAMLAHGMLVLDQVDGSSNKSFQILVEAAKDFTGSQAPIAALVNDTVVVDTGAARFTLVASPTWGFRFASVVSAGRELLRDHSGNGMVYMDRRRFDNHIGLDRLSSTAGPATAEIVKNGPSCAEIVVRGDLMPSDDPGAVPQAYELRLCFHTGSAKVAGELMLTNWSYQRDGVLANYVIPYEGFGLILRLNRKTDSVTQASFLRDAEQMADYDLARDGDSADVLVGFKTARWSEEYQGLGEKLYWPENQRVDVNSGGTDLRTKGYWLSSNGKPDPRYSSHYGNPDLYPLACAATVSVDQTRIAVQCGTFPEYAQPLGLCITQNTDSTMVDLALTDWRATNDYGKSIPWRSNLRKSFAVDFDFNPADGLVNFARQEQFPYLGIYTDVASYDGRLRRFAMISVADRNDEWKKTGFLQPSDSFAYSNPARKDLRYPFFIGANHTGGFNNWDQQYIQFLLGLHGQMGYLLELRWNVTFHSMLGVRQFDDARFGDGAQNQDQVMATQKWEIDIEHEDHKGYHLGAAFFGNPLDVDCLAHQAYFTLGMADVGKTLWIRAIGNRIGRTVEEQGFLRSLLTPRRISGSGQNIEDEILEHGLSYCEDFNGRRIDGNDPCGTGGWTVDPELLPPFKADPEDSDFPTASSGAPRRYPWVSKSGMAKVIDAFHLTKGLGAVREFLPPPEDFPAAYRSRIADLAYYSSLRLAQGGLTFAQWYAFLDPRCQNFDPACSSHRHLAPWERNQRQKKYYSMCMDICDDRIMDEDNNWMAYSFMDAYCEAAEQYLARADLKSAFYMVRYALNHLSSVRWAKGPATPCGAPPDLRQNDFFWGSMYPAEIRLWKLVRDWGFDELLESSYPNLFPVEKKL
ncbi:MAG: hypothetical protein U1E76_07470 [Planctomycetota bacterium]